MQDINTEKNEWITILDKFCDPKPSEQNWRSQNKSKAEEFHIQLQDYVTSQADHYFDTTELKIGFDNNFIVRNNIFDTFKRY